MTDWRQHTLSVLNSLNIRVSKSKGQNFLIKPSIISKIINEANITSSDHIIEIGGGVGILTQGLIGTEANITVIEKEPILAKYLETTYDEVKIIQGDALKKKWPYHNKVIANLPYSISSQILAKILHTTKDLAVVMVQKEVAERCVAQPGDRNYSRISVLCQLHANTKQLFNVGPNAFFPRPKITSTVLSFEIQHVETDNQHIEIENLVRSLFTLRRRTLRSVLRSYLKKKGISSKVWEGAPENEKRVFDLDLRDLDHLVTYLKNHDAWEKVFS